MNYKDQIVIDYIPKDCGSDHFATKGDSGSLIVVAKFLDGTNQLRLFTV
jgi:hypothetical protein